MKPLSHGVARHQLIQSPTLRHQVVDDDVVRKPDRQKRMADCSEITDRELFRFQGGRYPLTGASIDIRGASRTSTIGKQ